ncbi:MAG TPA: hypothetical protein VIL33_06135 [Rhodothermia bacterium]|nr:hypothetical protein [Thermoleophilia bacterium]
MKLLPVTGTGLSLAVPWAAVLVVAMANPQTPVTTVRMIPPFSLAVVEIIILARLPPIGVAIS